MTWTRIAGPAGRALTDVCGAAGQTWRIEPGGTVRVGETWAPYAGEVFDVGARPDAGRIVLAQETPNITPGVTLAGRRVVHVGHVVTPSAFRTIVEVI